MRLLLRPSTRAYRALLASVFDLPWLVVGQGGQELAGADEAIQDHRIAITLLSLGYEFRRISHVDRRLKGLLSQLDKLGQHFQGYSFRLWYEPSYIGYTLQRDVADVGLRSFRNDRFARR